ncbi:MAG: threonine--tRNA ligase [Deltaproteobacteria bacterium]
MTRLVFKDWVKEDIKQGSTFADALKDALKGARDVVAVRVNGGIKDLSSEIGSAEAELKVEPIYLNSTEGLEICRHSTSHVMAEAVKSLYKGALVAIGPATENGFYYDFDVEEPFTPEDLVKIEEKMRELVEKNLPFSRQELSRQEAISFFSDLGEKYKVELVRDIVDERLSIYRQGGLVDLCRGPHLPSTGFIKAFKLTGSAGAYWRGSEKNRMLQRIYGVAFAAKKDLEEHLKLVEEAKKRDHRRLGKDLDLFTISDDVGPGLVLWHPKGAIVRGIIEDFWKAEHAKFNYSVVYTPHIAMLDLWKKSGHWDFYRENLFSPMEVEGRDYIVKPMNCPFHINIFKSRLRSYRDLPIRYAELGTVYRYERSGVMHGLLRVRGFTQDDAHIFMTREQLGAEIKKVLNFTLYILRSFGFNEYEIYLSTRPEKHVGTPENWALAESALKAALDASGIGYSVDPGEGVFYGPKIDIKIKDSLGRSWQCSTIQVDFNLPERFDVTYRDAEGGTSRPIMLHRALMGSLERFFGCLVEHYAGAFPVWLAPVQATILTVTDRCNEYGATVLKRLGEKGIRAELDERNEKLSFKIREAQVHKIPYQLVVGDREAQAGLVSPRLMGGATLASMTIDEFLARIAEENKPRGGEFL